MSYSAEIEIDDPNKIKLLETEFKNLTKDRFQTSIKDNKIKLVAEDATALKAILNSISDSIQIFEKMEKLK